MYKTIVFLMFLGIYSCNLNNFFVRVSTKAIHPKSERCQLLFKTFEENVFYHTKDHYFLINELFMSELLDDEYKNCIEELSKSDIKIIFGSPNFETEEQFCYFVTKDFRDLQNKELGYLTLNFNFKNEKTHITLYSCEKW